MSGDPSQPLPQEQDDRQQHPPWFVVFEEKGAPGYTTSFMRSNREAIDVWKDFYPGLPVFTWQNDDNTLYRLVPISNFASLDTLHRQMKQVSKIMKTGSAPDAQSENNPSTISATVMTSVPELSYHSSAEFGPDPGTPYTQWMFIYLVSGKEEEGEQAFRNFRDYYLENSLDYTWHAFRVLLGNNTPLLIGVFCAESPASFQEKEKKIWDKHGGELELLWNQVVRHAWKVEKKTGWFSQSLSNVPAPSPDEEIVNSMQDR